MTNVITIATSLCNNLIAVRTNGELVTFLTMPCPERPLITVIGCNGILETDPFWNADKPNYYTIKDIDNLFIAHAPVNADWNAIEGLSMILNKPNLSVYLTIESAIATYVPLSRSITINGVVKTLDSDPVWNVGTVLQVEALYPLTGGIITATGQIGIPKASNITDGYLSAEDWIAFNNKSEQGYYSELISGGVVTWSGTGLQFNISAASYYIAGIHYDSVAQVTALPPADPDFDRIDVIALDIQGDGVVVVGVPSSNPEVPQVDPSSQIALTSIHLAPGATTPSNITQEVIYDENTEWAHTVTSVTANFDDTSLPYHLSKAVNVSSYNSATNRTITFIRSSVFSMTPGTVLLFRIRLKSAYANNSNIVLKWGSGSGSMVTAGLTLATTHGFNKSTTGVYQLITVPISSFNFSNINVDRLRIALIGSGAGFYLDQVMLQGGLISSGLSGVTSFNTRTGNVMPVAGDYATFYPSLSVAYNNPTWIATLDYSKLINVPPNPGVTASPLSTTDDTNISLGLSGTPATALLQSVNIAVAWVGTLDDSRITSASVWNAKQDTFALGTAADYFRGDLTLAPFPTNVSSFANDAGYLVGVPDLQAVTDAGTSTTNSISIGSGFPFLYIRDTTAGSNAHVLLECNNASVGGGTTGFIALANTAGTRGYIMATNLTNGFGIKLQLPNYAGNFTRTLPVSVNGSFADAAGDISITAGATGTAGGDLSGSYPNPTVSALLTKALPSLATGLLKYNGTAWVFDTSTYLTTIAGIAAGGDLTGTYPNPTVTWANGYTTYDARYFRLSGGLPLASTQIAFGNGSNLMTSSANFIYSSGIVTINNANIGTTSTNGLVVSNTQASTISQDQWSPAINLHGTAWKQNVTAASQTFDWYIQAKNLTGTSTISSTLSFDISNNGAAQANVATLGSNNLGVGTFTTANGVFTTGVTTPTFPNNGSNSWTWGASMKLFQYQGAIGSGGTLQIARQGGILADQNYTVDVYGEGAFNGGINIRQLTKPVFTLSTSGVAGSTSYTYVVVAKLLNGQTVVSDPVTINTGNATLTSSNFIQVTSITNSIGNFQYLLYRTASGGTPSSTGVVAATGTTTGTMGTLQDKGGAGDGTTPITGNLTANLGIGVTTTTAALHIRAGIAGAGGAPLKFISGTNLTTPETGAVEYDGSHLYITIGSTRYQLDQQVSLGAWALTGTSTLTGVATITSNAVSQHVFNGTWTTTASNQFHLSLSPSVTSRATSSDVINVLYIAPTITATAIPQTLKAVTINPTFPGVDGTFTVGLIGLHVASGQLAIDSVNLTDKRAALAIQLNDDFVGTNLNTSVSIRSKRITSSLFRIYDNSNQPSVGNSALVVDLLNSSGTTIFSLDGRRARFVYGNTFEFNDGGLYVGASNQMFIHPSGWAYTPTLTFGKGTAPGSAVPIVTMTANSHLQVGWTADTVHRFNVNGDAGITGDLLISSLAIPTGGSAAIFGTAGTTTITYRVVARSVSGRTTASSADITVTTANATLSATNFVRISVPDVIASSVPNRSQAAAFFDIYRISTNGTSPTTLGKIGSINQSNFVTSATFDDTGLAGDGTTAPSVGTTGSIGVGTSTPSAFVDIQACNTNSANLRLRSGTTPTTPNDGDIWYNGTHLYFRVGSTSYQIDQQVAASAPSLTSTQVGFGDVGNLMTSSANLSYATNALTILNAGIANTSTTGFALMNTTPATVGVTVQKSPRIRLGGTAWRTSPSPTSQTSDWFIENLPQSQGTNISSFLVFSYSHDGGPATSWMTLQSGNVTNSLLTTSHISATTQVLTPTITSSTSLTFLTTARMFSNGNLQLSGLVINADSSYKLDITGGEAAIGGGIYVKPYISPVAPASLIVGTPGTTTIVYKIVPRMQNGTTGDAMNITVTTANATLTTSNFVNLTNSNLIVPPAYAWDVYRVSTNGTSPTTTGKIQTVISGGANWVNALFDKGAAGDGTTAPTTNTTGTIGIGVQLTTAALHIRAGIDQTGGAPLKFTSGTNLTALEDGAVEYNGTHLYVTIGSTRYQLDQQTTSFTPSLTSTQIAFGGGGNLMTSSANLVWDNTNNIETIISPADIRSTITTALLLKNFTAATAVQTVQRSPSLVLESSGWKTAAIAAAVSTDWSISNLPSSGITAPSSLLDFSYGTAGSYNSKMTLSDGGILSVTGTVTTSSLIGTASTTTPAIVTGANGTALRIGPGGILAMNLYGNTGNVLIQGNSSNSYPADQNAAFIVYLNAQPRGVGTNTAGGTTVTGSTTNFLDAFKIGDLITLGGETQTITAIASDTSMTTTAWTALHTAVQVNTTAAVRFAVHGNGLVGIGTASPTAFLHLPGSVAGYASLRIPTGTAPTSPNDGDMWYDGTNVKFRVGGTTKTFTLT